MPAPAHHPEQRAKEAHQNAPAVQERVQILLDETFAASYRAEGAIDRDEDQHIEGGDREQEEGGDAGGDDAADGPQPLEARFHRRGGDGDRQRHRQHDGGMADGKEETGGNRALALLHQLPRDVIDGGDVVGVYRMPEAEGVGERRGAEQGRAVAQHRERPGPGGQVGAGEDDIEAENPPSQVCGAVAEQNAGEKAAHDRCPSPVVDAKRKTHATARSGCSGWSSSVCPARSLRSRCDGRSPGSRFTACRRPSQFPSGRDGNRLAAYSCGGSHGLAPFGSSAPCSL